MNEGVILAVFQQWCGINVIFNYAEEIFLQAGLSTWNPAPGTK
jgi:SP family sugar porter-like MFS transporter